MRSFHVFALSLRVSSACTQPTDIPLIVDAGSGSHRSLELEGRFAGVETGREAIEKRHPGDVADVTFHILPFGVWLFLACGPFVSRIRM